MESVLIGHGIRVNGRDYEIVAATGGDVYASGGPTVFDVFDVSPYTFLELERSSITGNTIVASYEATGVFKLRTASVKGETLESVDQGATLHIRPTEPFLSNVPSNREHYRLTLIDTDLSDYTEAS